LQLPQLTKPMEEVSAVLEIWLYFLRYADKMDTEALPAAFQRPMILRAFEELKMLTQTDLERERYEARRKALLDHNTLMKAARLEGERIGIIHLCERMLKRPETPAETLAALSIDELTRLAEDLQREVLNRG
jgi:hypothetical protein